VVAAKKLISPATATNSFWTDLQNSPKGQVSNQLMVVLFIFTMHFEDGNLFDSSYEDVNTWVHLMKIEPQNGYQLFLFKQEKRRYDSVFWKD
jgi:hypothetical protein